jgi:hypothetical protein
MEAPPKSNGARDILRPSSRPLKDWRDRRACTTPSAADGGRPCRPSLGVLVRAPATVQCRRSANGQSRLRVSGWINSHEVAAAVVATHPAHPFRPRRKRPAQQQRHGGGGRSRRGCRQGLGDRPTMDRPAPHNCRAAMAFVGRHHRGQPPWRPRARAAPSPARVRSRIRSRSNSAVRRSCGTRACRRRRWCRSPPTGCGTHATVGEHGDVSTGWRSQRPSWSSFHPPGCRRSGAGQDAVRLGAGGQRAGGAAGLSVTAR